jgi:hypothetical protein
VIESVERNLYLHPLNEGQQQFCIFISMKKLSLIFLVAISFTACKKDKTLPQPAPASVTITSMSDTTKMFYAVLQLVTTQNISILPTSLSNTYFASATFSPVLQQLSSWYMSTYVNLVQVNNTQLTLSSQSSPGFSYYDNYFYTNDSIANWHILGKNNIPSFDYTGSGQMPFYNYILIPDSINRNQDFTLPVNPARAKTFEVYIKNTGNSYTIDTIVTLTSNQISITIPAAKLNYLANDYNQLIITQINRSPKSVNGLPMCFVYEYQSRKPVFFK